MIFHEIYSAYYNAVAGILACLLEKNASLEEIGKMIRKQAFSESAIAIEAAVREERWQLFCMDGTTALEHVPSMPLTTLQKRWLKAVSLDPRIRLFDFCPEGLEDVEPLFTPQDYNVFDKYSDGDPFEDETYIHTFRVILDAIKNKYPLQLGVDNRKGLVSQFCVMPKYLEYSEKDDKFRLIVCGSRRADTVNLGRIVFCRKFCGEFPVRCRERQKCLRQVTLEVRDRRNALERVMLHFSHFEKEAEKLGEDQYRVSIRYDKNDETEIVIRVLSFGPMVRVIRPESFVNLIKERLEQQISCGL